VLQQEHPQPRVIQHVAVSLAFVARGACSTKHGLRKRRGENCCAIGSTLAHCCLHRPPQVDGKHNGRHIAVRVPLGTDCRTDQETSVGVPNGIDALELVDTCEHRYFIFRSFRRDISHLETKDIE
jgi:hypothetical protein